MAPVREEFTRFSAAVAAMEKNNLESLGALRGSIDQVVRMQSSLQDAVRTTNDATGQLRNALQNPRVAGNWNYVRAVSEPNEEERKRLLKQSALDLKSRITELRARNYDRIEGYAGMTLLFVPNESMLSSGLSLEPNLVEDALRYGIVICSPLLLLCYLRAFANGWRIAQQQENAEEVARRGRMLHDRLQTFFASVGKVGWYLNHTVEKFNIAVGKMDNLLVPARELGKLLAKTDEVKPVDSVDTAVRDVRFTDVEALLPSALAEPSVV